MFQGEGGRAEARIKAGRNFEASPRRSRQGRRSIAGGGRCSVIAPTHPPSSSPQLAGTVEQFGVFLGVEVIAADTLEGAQCRLDG